MWPLVEDSIEYEHFETDHKWASANVAPFTTHNSLECPRETTAGEDVENLEDGEEDVQAEETRNYAGGRIGCGW
jgi:hypothetical protein